MKKLGLAVLALMIGATAFAQGEGISFSKDSWKELLAQAKKENKIIFMDAYTTWCGPCKKMSKEVFPQESVGKFYNENFINVKMDMEKGEGIELAELYSVRAFPTLLYIASDGSLVHRAAGYRGADDFISLGQEALDPSKSLSSYDIRYAEGVRDPEFLRKFTEMRYHAADGSHGPIAEEFLNTQDDLGSEDNMSFIMAFVSDSESKGFEYLLNNRAKFEEMFGARVVTQKVQSLIYNKIYYSEPKPTLDEIQGIFKKYFPEKSDLLYANFKMSYFRQLGDREGYAKAAVERFNNFPVEDYGEYNDAAWTFYEVIDDENYLKQALKWGKKSVKMANRYENNDTVAHLYHKLGCKKKAIKTANKAIKIAKANNEDYSYTTGLLEKINAGE